MQAPRVLRFVESSTRVGRVAVVMSATGVVDIVLAANDASASDLAQLVESRFPDAVVYPDDGSHASWVAAVVARLDGAPSDFILPVDLSRSSRTLAETPSCAHDWVS